MKSLIKLLRVHQYVKNAFIFLPMFFAQKINDTDLLMRSFLAFIFFSLSASAIYILNDYFDIEEDRKHPTKKFRPLASGAISKPVALTTMICLALAGIGGMTFLGLPALYLLLAYLVMNLFYTFRLKHIPILDINLISVGFVIRIYVGSVVTDIELSKWIVLMTYLLALFLALAKRRDDVLLSLEGRKVRKAIDGYNLEFVNAAMVVMASVTLVSYIMYTIYKAEEQFNNPYLFLTTFFVILGVMRYMQITFVEKKSGSPTKILLKDLFLQITIAGWVLTFIVLIYGGGTWK